MKNHAALAMDADVEFKKGYDQAIREIERHFARTKRLDLALEVRKEWSIVWDVARVKETTKQG